MGGISCRRLNQSHRLHPMQLLLKKKLLRYKALAELAKRTRKGYSEQEVEMEGSKGAHDLDSPFISVSYRVAAGFPSTLAASRASCLGFQFSGSTKRCMCRKSRIILSEFML